MYDFFDALANAIVDRSADELIGAVIVALGLSLAFAGLDFIGRRKVRDARMPMIVLMIGANLISMAVAAGYLVHARRTRAALARENAQGMPFMPNAILVESIFRSADTNHDGLISIEEASVAAGEFVRRADPSGNGMIDVPTLEHMITMAGMLRTRRPPGLGRRRGRGHVAEPGRQITDLAYRQTHCPRSTATSFSRQMTRAMDRHSQNNDWRPMQLPRIRCHESRPVRNVRWHTAQAREFGQSTRQNQVKLACRSCLWTTILNYANSSRSFLPDGIFGSRP